MRALTLSLAAALLVSTSALASEPAWLDQADVNDDGFVTPAEAQIYHGPKTVPVYPVTYRVVTPRTTVATYTYYPYGYAFSPTVAYVAPAPSRTVTYRYALSPPVAYVAPSTIVAPEPRVTFVAPQPFVTRGYVLSETEFDTFDIDRNGTLSQYELQGNMKRGS